MKNLKLPAVIFSFLFITAALLPQESFEGRVEYQISAKGESTSLNYYIKDNMMKIDVAGEENASIIFNTEENKMILVMPDQNMYMEMPVEINMEKDKYVNEMNGEFKRTGETKDILGYKTEKWIYNDEDSEITAWMTQELGSFMFMANPMDFEDSKPEWQKELEEGGWFPMEITVKENDDEEATQMLVTSVEQKELDQSIFAVPEGYQKFDMPVMK